MCETAIAAQANPHMMRLDWINRRYLMSICLSNMEHAFLNLISGYGGFGLN